MRNIITTIGSVMKPNLIGEKAFRGIHSKTNSVSGLKYSNSIDESVEIKTADMLNPDDAFLLFLTGGTKPLRANEIKGGKRTKIRRVFASKSNASTSHKVNLVCVNCLIESF